MALVWASLMLLLAGCATDPDREAPPVQERVITAPGTARPPAATPSARDADAAPTELAQPSPARPPEEVVERGTGVYIERVPAPVADAQVTEAGEVTLNFVNADVREVIDVVLGDILERNYVVSPEVAGTITIRTEEPIPRAAVLDVFERALQMTGATIVARQGLLEVVHSQAGVQTGASIELDSRTRETPGFGIEILPLEFVSASEMQEILAPVVSPETVLEVDAERNLLIVAGTRAQRTNVSELVNTFDVDWLAGRSVGLFPLEFAGAEMIAEELRSIFSAAEGEALAGVVRFSPVERLNAVLVISAQADYLDRAATWIRRLDQGLGETSPQVFVYHVQNKRAADLADVLAQIFSPGDVQVERQLGEVAPGRTPGAIGGAPRLRGTELQLGARGTGGRGLAGRQTGGLTTAGQTTEGEPAQTERALPSMRERRRLAPEVAPVPGELPSAPAPDTGLGVEEPGIAPRAVTGAEGEVLLPGEQPIRIIADETSNAIVVLATPRDYRRVESALRRLDITPLQVLIEATIAEVTLNDNLEYGLQWFFESGEFTARFTEAANQQGGPVIGSIFPGFSAVFSGGDARAVLNAVASVTDLNVISAPQVLVLDNQTAVLQVGDQVPVPVRQVVPFEVVDEDVGSIVNAIEFRDTGTILLVTPRVNAGGLVTLDIEQEVSDAVQTVSSGIDAPTIQRRLIQTTVAVDSGETLALGGLIRDRTNRTRTGVPLLMDIPILGALFRRTTDDQERSEILVLITPRVVRNTEEGRAVTSELRQRLRSLAPLERRIYVPSPPRPAL